MSISASDLVNKYVGQSEQMVKALFKVKNYDPMKTHTNAHLPSASRSPEKTPRASSL